MELAKIRWQDSEQEARGLGELMKRFRVITIRDPRAVNRAQAVHYIPQAALSVLDGLGVKYELIESCSEADAFAALRDSAAVAV